MSQTRERNVLVWRGAKPLAVGALITPDILSHVTRERHPIPLGTRCLGESALTQIQCGAERYAREEWPVGEVVQLGHVTKRKPKEPRKARYSVGFVVKLKRPRRVKSLMRSKSDPLTLLPGTPFVVQDTQQNSPPEGAWQYKVKADMCDPLWVYESEIAWGAST